MQRFTQQHVDAWHRDGGVLIERFFDTAEVAAVRADFEQIFGRVEGEDTPKLFEKDYPEGPKNRFDPDQFATFDAVPFDCSPALNLIGVHPALIALAKALLATNQVQLYQCQAWAKFTGDADYNQPFHCDFSNHTLTVPAEDAINNCATILCYFTDVTEAHGPMHYVKRTDSAPLGGPDAQLLRTPGLQRALAEHECSSAAPAGSIFPYSIDVYHRGTNLTVPGGVRYAVMACFKRAGDEAIGYHAWQYHHTRPWQNIFNHATPEQLSCFGVQPPGHPFWTDVTLARAQARYPDWDMSPYREALAQA